MKTLKILANVAVLAGLVAVSSQAAAESCAVAVDSNDAMRFDVSEIKVDASCDKFTINLSHSGKFAANVMGHNVVVTKAEDVAAVARDGISAGIDNSYVKPGDDRVIAFTDVIGGGEKTSVTVDVSKLSAGQDYAFFCSFPGHSSIMRGSVSLVQ